LVHVKTGQSIISGIELPQNSDPQKLGSAITYYRRYTLVSLLGLQAEDDDGNSAKPKPQPIKAEITLVDALAKLEAALDLDALGSVWTEIGKSNQENVMVAKKKDEMKDKLTKNG